MNVKSANRENNQLKVVVTVEPEQFELGLNKAYLKNRKYIAVPGFRKGKAPRRMIENLYGKEVFHTDAVEEIFPEVFQAAVLDQGWKTVGQPSVTDMNVGEDNSLELTIETALYPEVTLGQYKGLEVPKTESVVTDEEVERELDKKAEEVSRIETVDRPAENGDTAVIDFEGFLDGVPFDGGKGEDYQLTLGSHSFIPGFEEQVVGMSADEEKDINVTFPEDYHAEELKGKPVVFKVKVHEVKKTIVPEKDDELAKDVSEFDTLDELRADLRANLLKQKEEENTRTFESAAVQMAVANLTVDVPAPMVDEQVEREMERFDSQLRQQGMSLEQYAKMFGGNRLKYEFCKALLDYVTKLETLMVEAAKRFNFVPPHQYAHTKELVKGVIGYGSKMGEGWLLTAEMIELADTGYENIVCTQPFGCLPNHINGKGAIRKIKEIRPNANIVTIDYDPGAPKVNQENRIKLMLAVGREELQKKLAAEGEKKEDKADA